jgi:hypothetical protein
LATGLPPKEPIITEASLEIILAFKLKNKTENVFIRIFKVTAKI